MPKSTTPHLTPLTLLETSASFSMNTSPFLARSQPSPIPAQLSDHPAPTDPELSCTCCCQSNQPMRTNLSCLTKHQAVESHYSSVLGACQLVVGAVRAERQAGPVEMLGVQNRKTFLHDKRARTTRRRPCAHIHKRSLGSRVVSVLDSGAVGRGFMSQPRRCRVTVLGKLFTPIVPLFTEQRNWWQPS